DRRDHCLYVRRSVDDQRSETAADLPRARRMQRPRRVRLRYLHLPALSRPRHRRMRKAGAARRRGTDRLQSQGRPRARRGHQVPRLQCAQAAGRRRSGRHLFRAHRVRRRRAGRALPTADAGRAALARHLAHRPLRLDVEHEIRCHRRERHRYRRARADSRRTRAARRAGGDRREESGRLLHAGSGAGRRRVEGRRRPQPRRVLTIPAEPHTLAGERDLALSLLSAGAVRERAREMLALGRVDEAKLAATADYVTAVIRTNYPDLLVPLHARWRHFVFGGCDLWAQIAAKATWRDVAARARAEFDLAIVSVLLDAGAGPDWRYKDAATGLSIGRSEGLALASLRMFAAGLFSTDARDPLRADAERLMTLSAGELAQGLQGRPDNPLAGLDGRAALLQRLGRALHDKPAIFASHDAARAGGLFDHLFAATHVGTLPAR